LITLHEFSANSGCFLLAQRPGSYVALKYVRPVIKRKETNELVTPPLPVNVLDKSIADVSFLAMV